MAFLARLVCVCLVGVLVVVGVGFFGAVGLCVSGGVLVVVVLGFFGAVGLCVTDWLPDRLVG